jgi:protein-S-isoprenylcysteine O-methyltransferase Ste14
MTGRALRYAAIGTVAAQGVLLVVFFTVPGGDNWAVPGWRSGITSAIQIAGWAVLLAALVNLGRSLTALPTPTGCSTLKTTGLYRLVRHPIYTGLLAIVIGAAFGSGRTVKMLLALALLGLLSAKARWEEDIRRFSLRRSSTANCGDGRLYRPVPGPLRSRADLPGAHGARRAARSEHLLRPQGDPRVSQAGWDDAHTVPYIARPGIRVKHDSGTGGGRRVVNRQVRSAAMRLPSTSATPASPPLTVRV